MTDSRTPCQKIDALFSRYRRPILVKELVSLTGERVDVVLTTVNRMIGAGLLGALSGGFAYRPVYKELMWKQIFRNAFET